MTVSPEPALAVAAGAATWKTVQAYRIPSRSRTGVSYLTTADWCTCKASVVGPRPCLHSQAVALVEQMAVPVCTDLVLERLPSGSYAWLRAEVK